MRESDFDFVQRVMTEESIGYWLKHVVMRRAHLRAPSPCRQGCRIIDDVRGGKLLQRGGNRDAWFRLRYPEALDPLLHISVAVYATERGSRTPALVGLWSNRGASAAPYDAYPSLQDHTECVLRGGNRQVKQEIVEAT